MLSKQDLMYPFNRNFVATDIHNKLLNNSKEYKNLYKKQILN